MHRTSDSRNNEIAEIKLSIGQCKLLERLVDEKLFEVETGISDLSDKPLKTLIDVFIKATAETPEEKAINDVKRAEVFDKWARGELRNEVQYG